MSRSRADLSDVSVRHHDGAHVVCGVNGSTGSRRALVEAVRLAAGRGVHVRAVAAYQPRAYFWGAWTWLPWTAWLPVPDDPETEAAEQRPDGRRAARTECVRRARCPVLVVPRARDEGRTDEARSGSALSP